MFRFLIILTMLATAPAGAVDISQSALSELKWLARPLIIFADSPIDPRLTHQLYLLEIELGELEDRDVVFLVDSDPDERSKLRQKFRPRGFGIILLGKDGQIKYRKPDPVPADELIRLIDRMPSRKQEIANRSDAE